MSDLGEHFKVVTAMGKAKDGCVFSGRKYRITILSDVLLRLEYNEEGIFNDYPTIFATNRYFSKTPLFQVRQDEKFLNISNDYFILEYSKEKPFAASKLVPDSNLRITVKETNKQWYFNNPEVRNLKGTTSSLDYGRGNHLNKGLYSLDGFASIDDSMRPVLVEDGTVRKNPSNGIDLYLFVYRNDFYKALESYYELTGHPTLIPRYALGTWWNKDENYNSYDIEQVSNNFKKGDMPISVFLLGNKYNKRNANKQLISNFDFDEIKFSDIDKTISNLHDKGIYFGLTIKPSLGITPNDKAYQTFKKELNITKDGVIPINVYNSKTVSLFLSNIIDEINKKGVDFYFIDEILEDKTLLFLYIYYIFNNYLKETDKRPFILARNPEVAAHKYTALYSGKTEVSWKTLNYLPYFNISASNMGVCWWSHDIGGFTKGIEEAELYTRYVQFGVYSPILRFASEEGRYYKREPWKWDVKTEKIVKDYLRLRSALIPYLYSEAYKYSVIGRPLIVPLYYNYKEVLYEPLYKNEYYFGSELFVSPITEEKDKVMNRVLKKILLPEGTWYDFKTGKKFPGGKRYATFYKDEDYPVYAKSGAIIPMAMLDNEDLNDTNPPKKLEIHIFPGKSNSYNLFEDDGVSNLYKAGYYIVTNIDYNYRNNNYTLIIRPVEGKTGIIPEFRDYKIRFRNTKNAENVKVNVGMHEIERKTYIEDNDFIVEIEHVPTNQQITIICGGKAIEIDAVRIINDDIDSIISDLQIETTLKEKVAEVLFSDKDIRRKRIEIRKLRASGLNKLFVRMFIKLLEYISEI